MISKVSFSQHICWLWWPHLNTWTTSPHNRVPGQTVARHQLVSIMSYWPIPALLLFLSCPGIEGGDLLGHAYEHHERKHMHGWTYDAAFDRWVESSDTLLLLLYLTWTVVTRLVVARIVVTQLSPMLIVTSCSVLKESKILSIWILPFT